MLAQIIVLALATSARQTPPPDPVIAKRELARQQGTWVVVSSRRDDRDMPAEIVRTITRIVEGDHVVWRREGKNFAGSTIVLDPAQMPHAIDVIPDGGPSRGKRVLGIYKLEEGRLTICMADPDRLRPAEFSAARGSGQTLMTFTLQARDADRRPSKP